jgi:hypothetical protein
MKKRQTEKQTEKYRKAKIKQTKNDEREMQKTTILKLFQNHLRKATKTAKRN